ncbi:MAG: GNAT family N-acetyltransferase [Actinomycetota bacterium]
MKERINIRPMKESDVEDAYRMSGLALSESAEEKERIMSRSPEAAERRKARYRHFLRHDPEGAWVAADGERLAGLAIALVREELWILSLFAVDAEYRNAGIGRRLLEHTLAYGSGCKGGMIASSAHPAAMRSYALAGFNLLPTLMARGTVKAGFAPPPSVREGTDRDLELVAEVDRFVRGAAHGPDIEILLRTGGRLLISEDPAGYAVEESGSPHLVAATAPRTAADLLRAVLARSSEGEAVEVRWISGSQSPWAVPVVLEAGLSLSPAGPICVRGEPGALAPYLPSGPFL